MMVSQVSPGWLKFVTFIVLLPLILLQAAGYRRPIRVRAIGRLRVRRRRRRPLLGDHDLGSAARGVLSNQGLTKKDFRAALGFIRLAESTIHGGRLLLRRPLQPGELGLIPYILPSIAIGVPIGAVLIQQIRPETFRRVCMSFDAWIGGFGLSTLVKGDLKLVEGNSAFLILFAVGLLDTLLLYRFFSVTLPALKQADPDAARRGRAGRGGASARTG